MNRNEIIRTICDMAPFYTPEWKPDLNDPDPGTALVLTFAELFAETYAKYDLLMEKHHIELMNGAGIEHTGKMAAEGFVCFSLAHGAPEGSYVEQDTPVSGENGAVYTTTERVFVPTAQLQSVYCRMGDAFYPAIGEGDALQLFHRGENRQRHHLYIGHDWLFAQSRSITLSLEGTACFRLGQDEPVSWEYFSGQWKPFSDIQWQDGQLTLTSDGDFLPTEVQGRESCFLRCRALSAEAGETTLSDLKLSAADSCRVRVYRDDGECIDSEFAPFGKTLMPYACCYIACAEAFGKKGAAVEIRFVISSHREDIANPAPEIPIQWRRMMRQQAFTPPAVYEAEICRVSAEYWNGMDFVTLPAIGVGRLFCTAEYPEQRTLSFTCPSDMVSTVMFGQESMWLRFRVLEVSNAHTLNTAHITPRLRHLTVSYHYTEPLSPHCLYTQSNREWTEGLPEKPFTFWPSDDCTVYFGFDKPMEQGPVGLLWETGPCRRAYETAWRIFSRGEWRTLPVTGSFWQTGVSMLHFEEPMEPSVCFGETAYWVRVDLPVIPAHPLTIHRLHMGAAPVRQASQPSIHKVTIGAKDRVKLIPADTSLVCDLQVMADQGDDRQHFVPWSEQTDFQVRRDGFFFDEAALGRLPRHKDTPVIEIRYRRTQGSAGNCEAGQITKLGHSVGYICAVTNPLPVSGGRDQETDQKLLARGGLSLSARDRAVSARDYEMLAHRASADLLKCKCVTGTNGRGCPEPGAVTLVCLAKEGAEIRWDALSALINGKAPAGAKVYVRQAISLSLSVTAYLTINSGAVIKARETVEKGLVRFLHPNQGNFNGQGFGIGEVPDSDHIISFLHTLTDLQQVESFHISAVSMDGNIHEEVNLSLFSPLEFAVPVSGRHSIKVNTGLK